MAWRVLSADPISRAALASWLLLSAAQLGWLPFTRYAWGFNFWQYLPGWAGLLLAAAALALCLRRTRDSLLGGLRRIGATTRGWPGRRLELLVFALATGVLWALRERQLFADSFLLFWASHEGWQFVFPDIGATFFMRTLVHLAGSLSLPIRDTVQLAYCACGGTTVIFALRMARYLGDTPGRAAVVALLVLSGGLLRVFAGHVEAYAVHLVGVFLYLWMALAYIERRVGWFAPCLALGLAAWLHLASLFLVPSLALLPRLAHPGLAPRAWFAQLARGAPMVLLPLLLFLGALLTLGQHEDFWRGYEIALEVLGHRTPEALNKQWWVRIGGEPAGVGVDYVFMSLSHLKYLANAAFVLAPFALPILAFVGWCNPGRFRATPAARFLVSTCLPTVAYAFMLRPFWGPFDWDLFSITAVCLSALAGHLLAGALRADVLAHVATCLLGFQLLFVGVPFLLMGAIKPRDAGPFVGGDYNLEIMKEGRPEAGKVTPWL